jgi:poly(3-hydroxyalkanoate) synthetase
MTRPAAPPGDAAPAAEAEEVIEAVRGANPFVGLTLGQVTRAGTRWAGALARRPSMLAGSVLGWTADEARVIAGRSPVAPDHKDRRFADPAWSRSPVWRRMAQSYLVSRDRVLGSVDRLDLDEKSAERARFALMQVTEAAAPTNNLLTNPAALRTVVKTRGMSVVRGGRHLLDDVLHNGGMPSQVDTRPFKIGVNTAATPGAMFASERAVQAALARSRRRGVLSGASLAKMFAFVRPNDLIWNYVVSSYLLGQDPPAFDVLAWNSDGTDMPAALHATFLDMWLNNALVNAGRASVLGTPVDLGKVNNDMYVVGARADHLVPWQSAHAATRLFGGDVRYVLSNSGHIQALVNPPGNPKATYLTNDDRLLEPEAWLKGACRHQGSWWEDWAAWSQERSGDLRPGPASPGDVRYPRLADAPGPYVTE